MDIFRGMKNRYNRSVAPAAGMLSNSQDFILDEEKIKTKNSSQSSCVMNTSPVQMATLHVCLNKNIILKKKLVKTFRVSRLLFHQSSLIIHEAVYEVFKVWVGTQRKGPS